MRAVKHRIAVAYLVCRSNYLIVYPDLPVAHRVHPVRRRVGSKLPAKYFQYFSPYPSPFRKGSKILEVWLHISDVAITSDDVVFAEVVDRFVCRVGFLAWLGHVAEEALFCNPDSGRCVKSSGDKRIPQ